MFMRAVKSRAFSKEMKGHGVDLQTKRCPKALSK